MPTTIHVSDRVLAAADRRARALGISRNKLIVRALERELADAAAWSPGFLDALRSADDDTSRAADELLTSVLRARRSKPPAAL